MSIEIEKREYDKIQDDFLSLKVVADQVPALKGSPLYNSDDLPSLLKEIYQQDAPEWKRIVAVRFGEYGRVYDYFCEDMQLKINDPVVADHHDKGVMLGWVAQLPLAVDVKKFPLRLKSIKRQATQDDLEQYTKNKEREEEAVYRTKNQVQKYRLSMEILRVEYTLDQRKAIVYFMSENRVDFRNLLKELVHVLKAKVELRQVGVRDVSKESGGIGPCGEELCCSRYLKRFHPVNIGMARTQNLSLKPTRVTGVCGRLKCCLQYEEDVYRELARGLPRVGGKVSCSKGCGTVSDIDILKNLVTVRFDDGAISQVEAKEIFTNSSSKNDDVKNEKVVATTDHEAIKEQIEEQLEGGQSDSGD